MDAQPPKRPWRPRDLLFPAGVGCILISVVGLFLAWTMYDVMSTFPVPGTEPVEPDTGPSTADVRVFVCVGLVGVAGSLMIVLSKPWKKTATDGGPVAE